MRYEFCFCKQNTAYEMRISDWSSDVFSSDLIRSSFTGFAPSSLDFELIFDVHDVDYDKVAAARTDIAIRLFESMTGAGYDFAYPTHTSFTAAPDGTMILPYADAGASSEERRVGIACVSRCRSRLLTYH